MKIWRWYDSCWHQNYQLWLCCVLRFGLIFESRIISAFGMAEVFWEHIIITVAPMVLRNYTVDNPLVMLQCSVTLQLGEDFGIFFHMLSNLIANIPYLAVDSFESSMSFNDNVWYGRACLGLELLHICHFVVYTADGFEITHIYISVIYRINTNIVDVYHSTCPEWNFFDTLEFIDSPSDSVEVGTSIKWPQT